MPGMPKNMILQVRGRPMGFPVGYGMKQLKGLATHFVQKQQ